MTRHVTETRVTRTCDLAGAAFYYAHGLGLKALEMESPEGKGGALNVNFVFAGGPELTALADEFQDGNPEVTLEQIRAFVAVLNRRLSRRGRSTATQGDVATGGFTTKGGGL